MIDIWDIFARAFFAAHHTFQIRIHAFVLMHNHFHLLATLPVAEHSACLDSLYLMVTKAVIAETGKQREVFSGRFHCCHIRHRIYYDYAYKYVYRNPVQARLCSQVENHPYSTLRGILGWDRLPFPAYDNMGMIVNPGQKLSWLNSPFPNVEIWEELQQAMQRPEFKPDLDRGRQISLV